MSDNERSEMIKGILDSIGALAEMTKIAYDRFIEVGFDNFQALSLCKEMVKTMLTPRNNIGEKD